ncbi:DUF3460 family protein [Undibacterium sp.]|uniref:DUF3460 family protein n=1 Tax=Undibacterium sp. TaxID=1914977 RepID=UPI00374CA94F
MLASRVFNRFYSDIMIFSKQFARYESEATQFIQGLKKANPELEQSQRDGRALLWDKAPVDLDTQKRAKEARINQQAYVYQNKG